VLGGFSRCCQDFQALPLGLNTHGGDDAGRQAQCAQIGGREGGAHALVVRWGIRENLGAALTVDVFAAKTAEVGTVRRGHGRRGLR